MNECNMKSFIDSLQIAFSSMGEQVTRLESKCFFLEARLNDSQNNLMIEKKRVDKLQEKLNSHVGHYEFTAIDKTEW